MVLSNTIVVDARDHMIGRLASVVAKELLAGQTVVVVRCEELIVSGSSTRNETKWTQFKCVPYPHPNPTLPYPTTYARSLAGTRR